MVITPVFAHYMPDKQLRAEALEPNLIRILGAPQYDRDIFPKLYKFLFALNPDERTLSIQPSPITFRHFLADPPPLPLRVTFFT